MKIEYLIIVKQDNTFCDTKEAFLNFLRVDSSIEIAGDTIQYSYKKNSPIFGVQFSIETGEIPSKKERYFHLILNSHKEDTEQEFTALADTIREIALRINPGSTRVNTLWNDIGRQYAIQAYPLINEVENLMRKLISKFMLINVGMDWSKEAIHSEILDKIEHRHGEQDSYLDILHKTDFIHLSDVLFRKYRTLDLNELDRILLKEVISEETFERIKKVLPKSNWERHFSGIIRYDEDKLKKKWQLLYELRNDIAHNRYISESDFAKIKGLVTEIKKVLIQTINELDKIDLTEEDKENIIISYQPTSMAAQYYLVEKAVAEWYIKKYSVTAVQAPPGPMEYFDLLVQSEDNRNIAVEIKSFSVNNVSQLLHIVKDKIIGRASKLISDNQISEFHIVLVIRDFMNLDTERQQKIIHRITDFHQHAATPQIKFITGFLDNDNQFVENNI